MEKISRTKIVDLLKREDFGAMVNVKGWVRTRRGSKQVNFIALNDGSTINNVQIVVDLGNFDEEMLKEITTGACLSVNGVLTESVGSGQKAEVQAREIEVLGACDNTYPLQKKGHSMEFLREIAHLRPRTNTFGAVFRIRHNMAIAIHKFFHDRGFFYFHTPIITASDCEGAGQMFQVTTKNLYDLKKDENGSIIYDDDFFGKQLREAITEVGIDSTGLLSDPEIHTTLAMVHTYPDGDRDFSFYRNPGADMMLKEDEIPTELIKNSKIFHFGTLSMTHDGVRAATKKAISIAEEANALISFDPNLRPPLWKSLDDAKEQVLYGLGHCNILKISDNEIQWLTGKEDYTDGVNWIRERYNIPLILVSMGKEGSRAYYEDKIVEVKPFLQKNTIETTGAGDTFCGCVLHYICEHGLKDLTEADLTKMLTFANAAAARITTRKGALRVMPDRAEIEKEIESR